MDDKKQNLTPELKQIYERVMNTSPSAPSAPVTPLQPATPITPPPQTPEPAQSTPQIPPQPIQPATFPQAGTLPQPNMPIGQPIIPQPIQTPPITPPIQPPVSPVTPMNQTSQQGIPPSLSNIAPKPLNDVGGKSFIFSNKSAQKPGAPTTIPGMATAGVATSKIAKKLSNKIIAVLVIVLVIVWSLFWAKFFKLF